MIGQPAATLATALRDAVDSLTAVGIAGAARDARILASEATGLSREEMLRVPETRLSQEVLRHFESLVAKRRLGEPVSRIVGRREFWGLEFMITPATLDPRPDSETLVEAILNRKETLARMPRILDVGTGSGCLLLALLHGLPAAVGIGIDISPAACMVAAANARRLGLAGRAAFVSGNWIEPLAGRFDIVVSNPPYIPSPEISALAPEVRAHDPAVSLDGGRDGLEGFRKLADSLGPLLQPDGLVAVEIGHSQQQAVDDIFADNGFGARDLYHDLSGRPRVRLYAAAISMQNDGHRPPECSMRDFRASGAPGIVQPGSA